jgi:hypothetical protein
MLETSIPSQVQRPRSCPISMPPNYRERKDSYLELSFIFWRLRSNFRTKLTALFTILLTTAGQVRVDQSKSS